MLTMGESFVLFLQIGNYFQLKSLKNSINQKKTKVNTFHIHKYYPVTKYEKIPFIIVTKERKYLLIYLIRNCHTCKKKV